MEKDLNDPIVITSAKRTAIGAFQGVYSNVNAPILAASSIRANISENESISGNISEVLMGCVLPAGLGQAPARQAALNAGIESSVPCTTINKMCGSGLKTVLLAHNVILADKQKIIIAGGMENMTLAPYLLPKARSGLRLGHSKVIDHMFYDGLEDAYSKNLLMGHFAERTAKKYGFSRSMQDEFAMQSATRAKQAVDNGLFTNEIASVEVINRKSSETVNKDEIPDTINLDKISKLKPAFVLPDEKIEDATVTAANSSSIADGASSLVLMRLSKARELNITPLAKIIDYTEVAQEPEWFTTAPVAAIKKLLANTGMNIDNVDLFEINEAFAVVTMAAIHDLKLPDDKVNVYGGACALGHPIGASGARILTTLVHGLQRDTKSIGVASLCIGGGEAIAIAVEML